MKHRALRGRIAYLHDRDGERGREWFSISVQDDGTRTLRAQCEMDDEDLAETVAFAQAVAIAQGDSQHENVIHTAL